MAVILSDAASAIEAAGTQRGFSIVYVADQGKELIVISAVSGSDRAICALALNRRTGVCTDDIALVDRITTFTGGEFSLSEPSDWAGPTCKVEIRQTAEIIMFPGPDRKST